MFTSKVFISSKEPDSQMKQHIRQMQHFVILRLKEPKKLLDHALHQIYTAASVSTKSQKVLADLSEDAFHWLLPVNEILF